MNAGGRAERSRRRPWVQPSDALSTAVQPSRETLGPALTADDLAGFWLLQDAPRQVLETLATAGERRHYSPGDAVFHQGDVPGGLYLVGAGSVRVVRRSDDAELVLGTIEAGDCVGEIGVIDGKLRAAMVVAATVSTLHFLPADAFLDVVERTPEVAMKLLGMLCARVRRTDSLAIDLPGTRAQRWQPGL